MRKRRETNATTLNVSVSTPLLYLFIYFSYYSMNDRLLLCYWWSDLKKIPTHSDRFTKISATCEKYI